jgi:hypothetical protein
MKKDERSTSVVNGSLVVAANDAQFVSNGKNRPPSETDS